MADLAYGSIAFSLSAAFSAKVIGGPAAGLEDGYDSE
jgi:hypothetical protein